MIHPYPNPRNRIIIGEIRLLSGYVCAPDLGMVSRLLHVRKNSMLSPSSQQVQNQMEKVAKELSHPAAVYGLFESAGILSEWFPDASLIALGAVTIGLELEERVDQLHQSGEIAASVILDAYGSGWVEGVADAVDETIRKEAESLGLNKTQRKSPGFHHWNIESQKDLFNILPVQRIGIRLTSHFIMIPRKSISFGMSLV